MLSLERGFTQSKLEVRGQFLFPSSLLCEKQPDHGNGFTGQWSCLALGLLYTLMRRQSSHFEIPGTTTS